MDSRKGLLSLVEALVIYRQVREGQRPRDAAKADGRPIFVHVPKAAGISVRSTQKVYCGEGHQPWTWYEQWFGDDQLRRSFCIVRGPYERLASAYHYLRSGGYNSMDYWWARTHIWGYADFNEFVSQGLAKSRVRRWIHFLPQTHYLLDTKLRMGPTHVLKLEELDEVWPSVALELGLAPRLPKRNVSPARQPSQLDRESLDVVNDVYRTDFELLGYKAV